MKLKMSAVALAGILIGVGVATAQEGLAKVKTIVVIYAENRSFDHLYGFFPGANAG
jgi:phospholipase C